MFVSTKLLTGSLVLMIGIPSALAKFPSDFIIHDPVIVTPAQEEAVSSSSSSASSEDAEPVFFPSDIPNGQLTRGQFIDAIGSRLYPTAQQYRCFGDLIGKDKADYSLLFSDMPITHPLALSVCVMMRSSLLRGSSNMLRPNQLVPVTEAAAIFSRLSVPVRNQNVNEPWYQRYMESMRSLYPRFNAARPGDILTGVQLRDMFCSLKRTTPQLDPMDEFRGC